MIPKNVEITGIHVCYHRLQALPTPPASAAALRNPTSLGRMLELAMTTACADRLKNGVPLPKALLAALNQLAGELRIAPIG